ncbi:MAG: hypothetical protein IPM42_02160 [Saprospiraceae bacterium]|nr:hypothetical protein [Saprospiraceae bacterium]
MKEHCSQNLEELKSLLENIPSELYGYKSKLLSDASVGQHTRHIIEFYLCLIQGIPGKLVNYDNRKRDFFLETDLKFALSTISKVQHALLLMDYDKEIAIEGSYGNSEIESVLVKSSVRREMIYCLEHAIHHMALIKVGILEMGSADLIPVDFGVASSTIRFKDSVCAQ